MAKMNSIGVPQADLTLRAFNWLVGRVVVAEIAFHQDAGLNSYDAAVNPRTPAELAPGNIRPETSQ